MNLMESEVDLLAPFPRKPSETVQKSSVISLNPEENKDGSSEEITYRVLLNPFWKEKNA